MTPRVFQGFQRETCPSPCVVDVMLGLWPLYCFPPRHYYFQQNSRMFVQAVWPCPRHPWRLSSGSCCEDRRRSAEMVLFGEARLGYHDWETRAAYWALTNLQSLEMLVSTDPSSPPAWPGSSRRQTSGTRCVDGKQNTERLILLAMSLNGFDKRW